MRNDQINTFRPPQFLYISLIHQSDSTVTELSRFCRSLPPAAAINQPQTGDLTFAINIELHAHSSNSPIIAIQSHLREAFVCDVLDLPFIHPIISPGRSFSLSVPLHRSSRLKHIYHHETDFLCHERLELVRTELLREINLNKTNA